MCVQERLSGGSPGAGGSEWAATPARSRLVCVTADPSGQIEASIFGQMAQKDLTFIPPQSPLAPIRGTATARPSACHGVPGLGSGRSPALELLCVDASVSPFSTSFSIFLGRRAMPTRRGHHSPPTTSHFGPLAPPSPLRPLLPVSRATHRDRRCPSMTPAPAPIDQ